MPTYRYGVSFSPEPPERWWHVFLFMVVTTLLASVVIWFMGLPVHYALALCFASMGFFSFAAFMAEIVVMGLTAKAGGAFWFAMFAVVICKVLI